MKPQIFGGRFLPIHRLLLSLAEELDLVQPDHRLAIDGQLWVRAEHYLGRGTSAFFQIGCLHGADMMSQIRLLTSAATTNFVVNRTRNCYI